MGGLIRKVKAMMTAFMMTTLSAVGLVRACEDGSDNY